MGKFSSGLKQTIKNFDMYGHPIQLNFDKKDGTSHKTMIGATWSILIQASLLSYLVIITIRMFSFAEDKNSTAQTLMEFQDLHDDNHNLDVENLNKVKFNDINQIFFLAVRKDGDFLTDLIAQNTPSVSESKPKDTNDVDIAD